MGFRDTSGQVKKKCTPNLYIGSLPLLFLAAFHGGTTISPTTGFKSSSPFWFHITALHSMWLCLHRIKEGEDNGTPAVSDTAGAVSDHILNRESL